MQLAPCSEQGLTKPGNVSDMGRPVKGPTVGKATCLWEQEHKTILDTMRTGAQSSGPAPWLLPRVCHTRLISGSPGGIRREVSPHA